MGYTIFRNLKCSPSLKDFKKTRKYGNQANENYFASIYLVTTTALFSS